MHFHCEKGRAMRKSRKRNCKKLRLKHIPDFFDDVEEIVYTYRESLHGDISVEYMYCLTFNDGNPLATFEGTRPFLPHRSHRIKQKEPPRALFSPVFEVLFAAWKNPFLCAIMDYALVYPQ